MSDAAHTDLQDALLELRRHLAWQESEGVSSVLRNLPERSARPAAEASPAREAAPNPIARFQQGPRRARPLLRARPQPRRVQRRSQPVPEPTRSRGRGSTSLRIQLAPPRRSPRRPARSGERRSDPHPRRGPPRARRLPALQALLGPQADRLRRGQPARAAGVRRRGPGQRGGRAGRAVRRPRRSAPHEDDRGDGVLARRGLHLQRGEVPAPEQPQPGAGRDRRVRAVPEGAARRRSSRRRSSRSGSSPRRRCSAIRRRSPGCAGTGASTRACR